MWQIDEEEMTIIIFFMLMGMAFLFGAVCAVLFLHIEEQRDQKKNKKIKERLKNSSHVMCERTRDAGVCPGVCEKCAWGYNYDEK